MDNINDHQEQLTPYDKKPNGELTPTEDIYSAPSPANQQYTPQRDYQQNQPNYYSEANPDNQYLTNNPDNIDRKTKNNISPKEKRNRVLFAILLTLDCIIDIIIQIIFNYFNVYSMADDIAILIMLMSFYILYFICKNPQGVNKATAILFILIWLGGVMCNFLGIPKTLKDAGVDEEEFLAKVDKLADMAFEDQCTTANPRLPLVSEIKKILMEAYYGEKK